MRARVSRNVGSRGANEWRADPVDRKSHGPVLFYARYMLLRDVVFDVPKVTKTEGWAIGEIDSISEAQAGKGPKFALSPEAALLENRMIEELPEAGWVPFRFEKGTGFVSLDEKPRVLQGARVVLLAPGYSGCLDPRF